MAAKSKRSLPRTAIIGLAGFAIITGSLILKMHSHDNRQVFKPQNSASSSSASSTPPEPTVRNSVLPSPAGGAASQGAVEQVAPQPSVPTESTTKGTSGQSSAIGPNDFNTSYCTFTPGAICQIVFTREGSSKTETLDAKNIPPGGTASWVNWTPASVGITPGAWDVTASATVNGKTMSSAPEVMYVHS